MQVNLLVMDPCPPLFANVEPLSLALQGLRKKFEAILAAEGFSLSDLSLASLHFTQDPGKDDYCSICHAILKGKGQEPVEYIVNYFGETLHTETCGQPDLDHKAMPVRSP